MIDRRITLAIATAASFAVVAGGALAQTKWDMPTAYPASNFHTENIQQFAGDVDRASGGKLKITVHPNASLFKAPEIKRAVQGGQAQAGEILLVNFENEDALYGVDGVPFLATSYGDAMKLYKASKKALEDRLAKQGMKLLFAVPWQGRLSIGTWHGPAPCGADASLVTPEELGRFLAEINEAFPDLRLTADDVSLVQRGVVPATLRHGHLALADRPVVREHRHDGVDGAVTLIGVKYTTARAAAEEAVTLATSQIGVHAPSRTSVLPLPGGLPDETPCPVPGLDEGAWRHLQRVYGTQAARVAAPASTNPALAARLTPALPVTGLQLVEAARHEMAMTLDDAVLRRTGLGSARYPGDDAILRVERVLRDELGWTSTRVDDEIRLLKEFYLPVHV